MDDLVKDLHNVMDNIYSKDQLYYYISFCRDRGDMVQLLYTPTNTHTTPSSLFGFFRNQLEQFIHY